MVLVGYWPLNEQSGTTAYDHSGNENHGSIDGAGPSDTGTVNGPLGQKAFDFDGSDDYINLGQRFQFSDSDSFSLTGWYLRDSVDYTNAPRLLGFNTTAGFGLLFDDTWIQGDDDLVFRYDSENLESGTGGDVGVWYFFSVTYDGSTVKLYIDGGLEAEDSSVSWTDPVDDFIIGTTGRDGGLQGEYFDGRISEVRIYNHALTPREVQYLHQVGKRGRQMTSKKSW
jgi:hypothetical protein